ncbi:hypothetical protein Q73_02615 [Bacillus coahuilensis m2-6]|uniref:hypothetical protein n=1 Tax=Bacillus coahuilensis TaxID=408580 RepID=UPI00018514B3|nr:hypothetical protein [Bacillus coahuilensis]KUP09530.1 hypothetical protein Q73_02615 [Bacillus coahuilensis m2-6]
MSEIYSRKVTMNQSLSMQQVLKLYHFAKDYNGHIYFIERHKKIALSSLPKLVSYFLTSKDKRTFKIVIEGTETNEAFDALHTIYSSRSTITAFTTSPLNSSMENRS